ncbi:MAG TPA: MFS transporter [Candidatus Dormibacteraeota bacterium]|nr:MFS transporter [Candidatus Dormibacteraeota bacterium]
MSRRLTLVGLIATIGFQLRAPILGVPPVLPDVRDDLHLSFTAAGALTALPVLCLGAAAVPGAVLVNRFGARRVIGAATVGLGLAALLRLAPPVPGALYLFTAVMALCAAIAQPAMAVVVRAWFPHAVQRGSTVFTSALSLGGLGGATLSLRFLALGGWRASFAFWALLALAAGGLWLAAAPRRKAGREPEPAGLWELVRDPAVWHVAALFGGQSLIYYGAASWIPFEIRSQGPGFLALVMLLLNVVGLPVAFMLVALPWPWARSRRFYALAATLLTVATAGFALGLTGLAWLWAAILGVGGVMTFAGSTALPALFARSPAHVAGYAALVLSAGYAISFGGPFLGGLLLDHTHRVTSPFWLMTVVAATLVGLGLALPRHGPLAVPDDAQAA